jgi:hypothetical protein
MPRQLLGILRGEGPHGEGGNFVIGQNAQEALGLCSRLPDDLFTCFGGVFQLRSFEGFFCGTKAPYAADAYRFKPRVQATSQCYFIRPVCKLSYGAAALQLWPELPGWPSRMEK